MNDVFRDVKESVRKKEVPVRIVWEFRDMNVWCIEYEERSSGCHFQISGNAESNVAECVASVEHNAFSYKKRARG